MIKEKDIRFAAGIYKEYGYFGLIAAAYFGAKLEPTEEIEDYTVTEYSYSGCRVTASRLPIYLTRSPEGKLVAWTPPEINIPYTMKVGDIPSCSTVPIVWRSRGRDRLYNVDLYRLVKREPTGKYRNPSEFQVGLNEFRGILSNRIAKFNSK